MNKGPMPFRARGTNIRASAETIAAHAMDRHPDFAEMNKLLVMFGYVHYDDEREVMDGIVSARKFRTTNQQRLVTLWKNGDFAASLNYRIGTEHKGKGMEELKTYLRTTFGTKGDMI